MRPEQRRRLDRFWLVLGAALMGAIAIAAAFIGDTERIGAYWTHAHIGTDGTAAVVEVIDYDFGSNQRHGMLRQLPDILPTAAFTVESPTAPDQFIALAWWQASTELRIGDPTSTISNRHRYTITYPYDGLVEGDRIGWNAVGDGWDVPVNDVEVHLTADRALDDPQCDTGSTGDRGGCTAELVGPGHLVVRHDGVSSGEFLTVYATMGAPIDAAAVVAPTGPAPDPGTGWKMPPLIASGAALLGALALSPVIRRAGREWMWEGGTVDAAFGPDDALAPKRRVDHDELREMTTIEFEPPRDLSASVGGVVHLERVHGDHKMAWLLEAAIREEIELDPTQEHPTIRRGSATPNPTVGRVLDAMFGGSDTIDLEKYNPTFTGGWGQLGSELEEWRHGSGLWDDSGRKRRNRSIGFGVLGLIIGDAALVLGAAMSNRTGEGWFPLIAIGGLVAGAGLAAVLRAWELRVRTAEGSGAWIRIESFRRFLHDSEAQHVERAAEMGLLRQYTAWAVALGEVDRWSTAVEAAAAQPGSSIDSGFDTRFVLAAPLIASAVSTASTAPSSSGGGGGGAGGGGGGGGGGSW